jgi:hypothetical protein
LASDSSNKLVFEIRNLDSNYIEISQTPKMSGFSVGRWAFLLAKASKVFWNCLNIFKNIYSILYFSILNLTTYYLFIYPQLIKKVFFLEHDIITICDTHRSTTHIQTNKNNFYMNKTKKV